MRTYKSLSLAAALLLLPLLCLAQPVQEGAEMADLMRSNGKIYVVVGVLNIILLGMLAYLYRMDRRLKRMEEQHPDQKNA